MKLFIILISCGFLSPIVYACESQCASLLLRNLTDKAQSSIIVALIKNAQLLLDDANKYATKQTRCPVAESVCEKPIDCSEIMEKNPLASSGVYKVWLRSRMINGPIDVYWDMEDAGGAWTVLQRRGDFGSGQDYFYRDWQSYKHGFGDLKKDFWLGNEKIFSLTNQRANVVKFTLTDWEGNTTYATFDDFWIDNESSHYTLHATGYDGTAGDSLSRHNGQAFSTKDQDNDNHLDNCAVLRKGAWWYADCNDSNLNGLHFKKAITSDYDGIEWQTFKGVKYSLKDTMIKIRPNDFQKNLDAIQPH